MHQFSIEFLRSFARLGEYNTQTFTDGKHEDIDIVRQIPHEKWNRALLINDIAVLELARDVTFNGTKTTEKIFYQKYLLKILSFHHIQTASVQYVCQSVVPFELVAL